ncbi:MAG TPA: hypothetical protein VHG35_16610 [Gemmatimonadales bacterium]|nr:hypothetical protein [Gemmatimonadales bacterium]
MSAPEPAPTADPCLLPTGVPSELRELVVAVVRPEDTAAVARHQPEPLIRLDCTGKARPAAAESWTPDSTRRTWTFVLAPSALDLTAPSAAAEWRTRPIAASTLDMAGVESVVPLDDRRLVVTLDRAYDSVPALFADPSLALITDSLPAIGPTFVLRPAGADPRDALDAGADILRSDDPALLEYARSRSDVAVHPLPWSRTWVLLIPPGQRGFEDLIPADSASFRAGLARDAVRVEARAAEGPFWWREAGLCPEDAPAATSSRRGARVTDQTWADPVGRALAERLVALSSRPLRVSGGLDRRSPVPVIHSMLGLAYVLPVPRIALAPCREIEGWPAGATVVPLIDTRHSVVARRGIPQLTVEFDGRLRRVDAP